MTDLEKKIEEAAVFWCRDNQFATHKDRGTSFKDGAHFGIKLGREAMLLEVLEYMRKTGDRFLECADWERQSIGNAWKIKADAVEHKFKGKP